MEKKRLERFGIVSLIVTAVVGAGLGALAIQSEKPPVPQEKLKSSFYWGIPASPRRSSSLAEGVRHRYDFKSALQGDTLEHDFRIANPTEEPMVLTSVKGGWGFIVTASPRLVSPGEEGIVSVVILTDTYGGQLLHPRLIVKTSDPARPEVLVEGTLQVEKFADIVPFEILISGSHTEALQGEATVVPAAKYPFKIIGIKPKKGRGIAFSYEGFDAGEQSGYRVIVKNTLATTGAYRDVLFVVTDHPQRPEFKIRVRGDIH
jgi:hypothetical protein